MGRQRPAEHGIRTWGVEGKETWKVCMWRGEKRYMVWGGRQVPYTKVTYQAFSLSCLTEASRQGFGAALNYLLFSETTIIFG